MKHFAKIPKLEREGFRCADGQGAFGDQRKTEGSRPVKKHYDARQRRLTNPHKGAQK
jgi:hypothetical protein